MRKRGNHRIERDADDGHHRDERQVVHGKSFQ
jgi:hypothetical protein